MSWIDIASIVFACVTANHLGLIEAVTTAIKPGHSRWPIISCPKCLTWWTTMILGAIELTTHNKSYDVVDFVRLLAVSFLASYIAIWLELLEGYVDTLYMKLYDKIYNTSNSTPASNTNDGDTTGTVPQL